MNDSLRLARSEMTERKRESINVDPGRAKNSQGLVAGKPDKVDTGSMPTLAQTASADSADPVLKPIETEAFDKKKYRAPGQLERWRNEGRRVEPFKFGYNTSAIFYQRTSYHDERLLDFIPKANDSSRHTHVPLQESRLTKSEPMVLEPLDGPDGVKKASASRTGSQNQKRRRNELAQHLDHVSEYSKGLNDGNGTKCAVGVMAQAGSPWASKFGCPLYKEYPNDPRFHNCASCYSIPEEVVRTVSWNYNAPRTVFSVLMASL